MTEKTRASIHFVGAGPGAVDLITVRGAETLKKAQVVVYAGSLVNPALLEYCPDAKVYDSAKMTLDEVVDVMAAAAREGLELVRLHSGDPSVYGAIREQMDALDRLGIPYDSCPGGESQSRIYGSRRRAVADYHAHGGQDGDASFGTNREFRGAQNVDGDLPERGQTSRVVRTPYRRRLSSDDPDGARL